MFGGFTKTIFADGGTLPLREQISQAGEMRCYIFTGLTKCLYDCADFHSIPEKHWLKSWRMIRRCSNGCVRRWPKYRLTTPAGPANRISLPRRPPGNICWKPKSARRFPKAMFWPRPSRHQMVRGGYQGRPAKNVGIKVIPDDAVLRTNDFKFTIAQAVTVV